MWRQSNGSEDINITNFCKILVKFAIDVRFFEIVCHFLRLTIFTGQRNFFIILFSLLANKTFS